MGCSMITYVYLFIYFFGCYVYISAYGGLISLAIQELVIPKTHTYIHSHTHPSSTLPVTTVPNSAWVIFYTGHRRGFCHQVRGHTVSLGSAARAGGQAGGVGYEGKGEGVICIQVMGVWVSE